MKKINQLLLLIGIWLGVTLWAILQYDNSVFSLTKAHPYEQIYNFSTDKILSQKTVSGSFVSEYNHLGTVSLRFSVSQRVAFRDEDILYFRIKESDSDTWYFEAPYRSGLIFDKPFFPFGFPAISNSKGKTYNFELTSSKGNKRNAIAMRKGAPTFESRYIIPRQEVLGSFSEIINFSYRKFINKITTLEIVFISFISSLPLLLFIFWFTILYKHFSNLVKKHRFLVGLAKRISRAYKKPLNPMQESYHFILGMLLIVSVLIDTLFIHLQINVLYVVVTILSLRSFKNNKYSDTISACTALLLLILAPIALVFGLYETALASAAWSLVYFFIAVIFAVIKIRFINNFHAKA